MSPELAEADTTDDAVLGGLLRLRQPRRGHRVGHDAILLAAATGGSAGEHAVELGAGVGSAGLALAARVPGLTVTLVEMNETLARLAAENAHRNGLGERVRVAVLDVGGPADIFSAARLSPNSAARVLMNPPFNDPHSLQMSPNTARRLAHAGSRSTLMTWAQTAARLLRPRGILTLIWRGDGLPDVFTALADDFGAVAVLPVHPRPEAAAIRVLVRAVKGASEPASLLPGIVLNDATGRPTEAAEAVLRGRAVLPLAE